MSGQDYINSWNMQNKTQYLKRHVDYINKILSSNQSYLCKGVSSVVRFKENQFKKGMYEIKHEALFLKSEDKIITPCIKIYETWIDDKMVGYTYRFEIPYFEYCFACMGCDKKVQYKTFEFRYESHYDMPDHEPKDHLHILDNVPPRYHTHRIEFENFINIIKRDFIKDDKVSFEY